MSSASLRMRAAIRLDCTGEPPGELMISATAAGLPRAKARSICGAKAASFSVGLKRLPPPMAPDRRITGTKGGFLRKGINLRMGVM